MEAVVALAKHVRQEMGKVVVGQEALKTQCLIALLSQGHALLEGVPGIAKTLAIKNAVPHSEFGFSASAVHLRPYAGGHYRDQDSEHLDQRVPATPGSGFYQPAPGRRGQPHAAAHSGGAARMHAGKAGHHRRGSGILFLPISRSLPRKTRSILKVLIRCPRPSLTDSW